jgi:DNA-binding NarL/FixJ family response regulator
MQNRENTSRTPALPERRPRVALADDHPAVLAALQRLLQASCDVVACVPNGAQAIEAAATLRPDVLVVDLMMPDVDGLQVCRTVGQVSPETAVIIVSAFDDAQMRKIALQNGAIDFLAKSLLSDRLELIIARIFAER